MNINRVRLGLMYIFSETNKISKNSKTQLFRFIETANEHQLKVLMMDGELISSKQLDESTCDIIDDRFASSGIDPYKASTEAALKLAELSDKAITGLAIGAIATTGAIATWKSNQQRKLRHYCLSKGKPGSPEWHACWAQGKKQMDIELKKAREKAKQ